MAGADDRAGQDRVLTGARIVMRPHGRGDFADSLAMWADPRVAGPIGAAPASEPDAWARLLRYAGLWSLLGFGYWVVRARDGGAFLGEVGFAEFRRPVTPSLVGTLEMGWALAPAAWGQGIAGEAVDLALGWAATHRPDLRVTCLIGPDNAASIRVAERAGFVEIARSDLAGRESVLFERPLPARA